MMGDVVLDVEVKLGVGYVCMYVLYVLYVQGSSGESSVLTLSHSSMHTDISILTPWRRALSLHIY